MSTSCNRILLAKLPMSLTLYPIAAKRYALPTTGRGKDAKQELSLM